MNTYVIHITLRSGIDLAVANNNLRDVIQGLEEQRSTAVEAFYAVPATYDYIAILHVPRPEDAVAAATMLALGGRAKTSVSPAMTADAYGELLVHYGNKK
jgi:uncharacterized protein with GYD domain